MTGYIIVKTLRKNLLRNLGIILQLMLGSLVMTWALSGYRYYAKTYEDSKSLIAHNVYQLDILQKQSTGLGEELTMTSPVPEGTPEQLATSVYSIIKDEPFIEKIGKGKNLGFGYSKDTVNQPGYLQFSNSEVTIYTVNKEMNEMFNFKAKRGMDFSQYYSSLNEEDTTIPMLVSEELAVDNPIGSIVQLPPGVGDSKFKIIGIYDDRYLTYDQFLGGSANRTKPSDGYYAIAAGLPNNSYDIVLVQLKNGVTKETAKKSIDTKLGSQFEIQFYGLDEMADAILSKTSNNTKYIFYGIVVLILSSFGIISTVLSSTLKRKREFGARIAVGASKKYIEKMVIGEISCLFIVAQILNIIISAFISLLSEKLTFDWIILGISTAVTLVLIIFSIIPAFRRVFKMNPVDLIHERR